MGQLRKVGLQITLKVQVALSEVAEKHSEVFRQ
jgi:hypothetical protein